ncbi:MAG: response regulator transcription factor [Nitrospinae bacterium]|nr:response regulator transcription factor [Nitrospinota bacterium]
MRLLLAEDDKTLAESLGKGLAKSGFSVDVAVNGEDALIMGRDPAYEVVVLDLGLPVIPGLEVLRKWRREGIKTPVLILTARNAWHERVDGFKAGADDYLGKPFHIEELNARLTALIRRAHDATGGPSLGAGGLALDEDRQTVTLPDGAVEQLTGVEFKILRMFMLNPGVIISKDRLIENVYEFDSEKESNVIEVYIRRLRKKVGEDLIQTRRGQGYVFSDRG